MDLPSREALLDIHWIIRTHSVEGIENLKRYVRRGAEVYGGSVTAVAEAVLFPHTGVPPRWTDQTDVRHALVHKLFAGSWSPDPSGPQSYRTNDPVLSVSSLPAPTRAAATAAGYLVCGGYDETAVWRLDEPTCAATVPSSVNGRALAVSFDGHYAATASDNEVRLWSLPDLKKSSAGTRPPWVCGISPVLWLSSPAADT